MAGAHYSACLWRCGVGINLTEVAILACKASAEDVALSIIVTQCYVDSMDELTKAINHFSALMEDQNAKLDAVLEGQKDQATRADMHRIKQRLDALASDVHVMKAAVTSTNQDLAELDHRVARLEAA
jgi:hypothetical protein